MSLPKLVYRPNNKGPLPEDLTGKKFGKRFAIAPVPREQSIRPSWFVRCECGNEFISLAQAVKKGYGCKECAYKGDRPYKRKRPFEATYNVFKSRTRHKVELTYEQFLEFTKIKECHYCGAEIIWQEFRGVKKGGTGSNLDRKCSKGPYSMDNVVVCCGRCNYGKNRWFNYEEWKQIGELIRSWNKPKCVCVLRTRPLASLEKELEREAAP